jgi:hypothetical protein
MHEKLKPNGITKVAPMIAAGYGVRNISIDRNWLGLEHVKDSYCAIDCTEQLIEYDFPRINGHDFCDSPSVIEDIALEQNVSLEGVKMFYYEVYNQEFDEETLAWRDFKDLSRIEGIDTDVQIPSHFTFEGFDIRPYMYTPQCSVLFCNQVAKDVTVNEHCLISDFETAKSFIESECRNSEIKQLGEPGPYRIYAVYTIN